MLIHDMVLVCLHLYYLHLVKKKAGFEMMLFWPGSHCTGEPAIHFDGTVSMFTNWAFGLD